MGCPSAPSLLPNTQYTQSRYLFDRLPTCPDFWWKYFKHCFFSYLADFRWLKYSTDDCHPAPALPTRRWPQSSLLKASRFRSHISSPHDPLWISCVTQKHVCATWFYLHTLMEAFQNGVFPKLAQNFRFIRSSVLLAERPEKREKKRKSMWKMQW